MSRSQRSKVNFFNTDRQKTNVILASCRNFLPRKRCVKFIRCPLTSPLIACKITAITNYVRLALVFCSKCLQRSRDAIKANQRILITAFYPAHISCKGKNNDTKRQLYGSFFFIFSFSLSTFLAERRSRFERIPVTHHRECYGWRPRRHNGAA